MCALGMAVKNIDASIVRAIAPECPRSKLDGVASAANLVFSRWKMDSALERAHFLAQVSHETGDFRWMKEQGGSAYFRSLYEDRKDLGNTQPGDGERFPGRGWMMISGRANYEWIGEELGINLLSSPHSLESPTPAACSAAVFWCKRVGEAWRSDDLTQVTRLINGGVIGLLERAIKLGRAKAALGV